MQRTTSGSNEFNADELKGYLVEIDLADDEIIKLKMEHAAACKGPRRQIRDIMNAAKEAGINMTALRTVVAAHRAERRIEQKIADLEADDRADYELMEHALGAFGDTPLGAAALARAKARQQSGDKTMDSLHQ